MRMKPVDKSGAVCAMCRTPLEADGACLGCLLGLGLDDEEVFPRDDAAACHPDEPTALYGDFEIDRREDGSLWELGRGAMGITYRAVDRVLHRPVALKVIQLGTEGAGAGWHDAVLRERFLSEARAAATLRHVNVAGVLQFGAAQEASRCFCAMELVEGETLEARVRRDGPLDAPAALEVARQVASALVAAAERGLIHRDLKPANLMLTPRAASAGPEVKVIDFGLARMTGAEGPDPLSGSFVGTPAFASPEQLARQPVDARSDFYSLGVTLWYALTGQAPFSGRTLEELGREPARVRLPVEQLARRTVPPSVAALLRRLLAVDPDGRPRNAMELLGAVEVCQRRLLGARRRWLALAGAAILLFGLAGLIVRANRPPSPSLPTQGNAAARNPARAPAKSIAVLPFENLSGGQENAAFTDGVQEEILADLSRVSDLKVISRTSVRPYVPGAARNGRDIAGQLGVRYLVEGSVQRVGNQVRVSAELIDAGTDAPRWAEHYDRPLDDVFAIQSEIAQAIADQLRARLSPAEHVALSRPPTTDVLAFQLYQQARELKGHNSDPMSHQRLLHAVDLLDQCVHRDAQYLKAWCLLAEVHLDLYWEGMDHTDRRREQGRIAMERAAAIGPDAGETHLVRAIYAYHGLFDLPGALDELALARRTLPNNANVPFYAAAIHRRQGRWDDALREFNLAAELDPRNFSILSETAHTEEAAERYAEATRRYNQALAVNPGDIYTRERLALIPYFSRADPQPLHALHASLLAADPAAAEACAGFRLRCALSERDQPAARAALATFPAGGFQCTGYFVPPEWFAGLTARTFGDEAQARAAFLAARAKVERTLRDQPDFATAWSVLGWIDAGLGRKEEAIREGQRGCQLVPSTKDAYSGPDLLGYLAMIYAWTGEKDLAMETLVKLAHSKVGVSSNTRYGSLKLDPQWDPLRGDPRFEALLTSLAPKP